VAGPTVLTSEPAAIVAGDTITWTTSSPQFPSGSGYTLKYYLVGPVASPTAAPIQLADSVNGVTITQSGNLYTVTVPAATTASWAAGSYAWSRTFTSGANRYTEDGKASAGFMQVAPDPTVAPAATHATRTLAAIETALESLSAGQYISVSVDGISYTRSQLPELYMQRSRYKAEVYREQAIARGAKGLTSVVRMVPGFVRSRG